MDPLVILEKSEVWIRHWTGWGIMDETEIAHNKVTGPLLILRTIAEIRPKVSQTYVSHY